MFFSVLIPSIKPLIIKSFAILTTCTLSISICQAAPPSFANNILTLPSVTVGNNTFNNVKLDLDINAGTVTLLSAEPEHIFEMRTLLSPSLELPAVSTGGAAGSLISVDTDSGAISGFIVTKGLTNLIAAHIHEGAADESGDVIVTMNFDSSTNLFTIPSGTILTVDQISSLKAGKLYLNVHTETNESGELRSQLNINSGKNADANLTSLIDP